MLTKVLIFKAIVFPVVMLWIWELDYKESWAPKNWCFWTVVLENTLESPLDCKEIKPVHSKGNQSWIFIGRAEAETPIRWPSDAKNWLIWKDPDAGKDWRQEKWTTEGEMVGWYHWLNGHEFEHTLGDGDGQRGLACCSPWGCKESDPTEWLNWRCFLVLLVIMSLTIWLFEFVIYFLCMYVCMCVCVCQSSSFLISSIVLESMLCMIYIFRNYLVA